MQISLSLVILDISISNMLLGEVARFGNPKYSTGGDNNWPFYYSHYIFRINTDEVIYHIAIDYNCLRPDRYP